MQAAIPIWYNIRVLQMTILNFPKEQKPVPDGVVLAAGFFDGLHLGHAAVLEKTLSVARRKSLVPWVLTFDRHPRSLLSPGSAPPLITNLHSRLSLFEKAQMRGALVIEFGKETASLSAEAFAGKLLEIFPRLDSVCCGEDWRFAKNGEGTPQFLAEMGKCKGFEVNAEKKILLRGREISSTAIRAAILGGEVDLAGEMLGRPFSIAGEVLHGRRIASANGFATANVSLPDLVTPKCGVYAVSSIICGRMRYGVANIGFRPTFPGDIPKKPILEVHFLDFSGDLYGKRLEISFLRRIRGEVAFPSADALFAQVGEDARFVREMIQSAASAKRNIPLKRSIAAKND